MSSRVESTSSQLVKKLTVNSSDFSDTQAPPHSSGSQGIHRTPSCFEKFFSPCGADSSPPVLYYVVWDWASKVTVISFNASNPLLITHFGDVALGKLRGKILWTYLTAGMNIFTAICFLTFTAIIEYEYMRRKAWFWCGFASAICLILFVVCYNSDAVYFACALAVVSHVSFNISNLAFDSLLNAVSGKKDSHQISSRSFITGYIGLVALASVILLVLALIYFLLDIKASFILYGIAPNVSVGIWYLVFGIIVQRNFPLDCGVGPPFPLEAMDSASIRASRIVVSPLTSAVSSPLTSPMISVDRASLDARRFKDEGVSEIGHVEGEEKLNNEVTGIPEAVAVSSSAINNHGNQFDRHKERYSDQVRSYNSEFDANQRLQQIEKQRQQQTDDRNNASVDSTGSLATSNTINSGSLIARESYSILGSIYWFFAYGLQHGTRIQLANIKELHKFPDLFLFIIAFMFIEGAQNTGVSLAAIIVVDLFSISDRVIVACGACGLFSSIVGLYIYRYLNYKEIITPKGILITNILIFIVLVLSFLFISEKNADICFILFAIIGGSQIGSVGAFARSIVANLCPSSRQSRIFSLYQFVQVATAWIGPLIIASVNSATNGNCWEFIVLTVSVVVGQLLIGLPLLWFVDETRGLILRHQREEEDGYMC